MNKNTSALIFGLVFLISFTSAALLVDSDYVTTYPGQGESVTLEVENNIGYDLTDVSVQILLPATFSSVGSSQKTEDIDDGDSEKFTFEIKTSSSTVPGDYNIPYLISYKSENNNLTKEQGTFGFRVSAETDLEFSSDVSNAIVDQKGKVSIKIINRGLAEIKFINVKIVPNGFDLLSSEEQYIGSIASDDSDTATFDVLFKQKSASVTANIYYKDFDNQEQAKTITLPLKVYTQQEALNLGLIKKSYTWVYILVVAILIVLWLIYRAWKKARKKKLNGEIRR